MTRERLHKVLAQAGIASRRAAEELIAQGRITVDGITIREMGVSVDPATQEIRFDGERIQPEKHVYFAVHKPAGYLSTSSDDRNRKTVMDLVVDRQERRLYPVGRLDLEGEGLILLTNDGEFANRVSHARYGVERTYELRIRGFITPDAVDKARSGVWLSDGRTPPVAVYIIKRSPSFSTVKVVARSGADRNLRRLFAKLGHNVDRLVRTKIGTITISGLRRGAARRLDPAEVKLLIDASAEPKAKKKAGASPVRRPAKASPRSGERGRGGEDRRAESGDRRPAPSRPRGAGSGRGGPSGSGGPRRTRRNEA